MKRNKAQGSRPHPSPERGTSKRQKSSASSAKANDVEAGREEQGSSKPINDTQEKPGVDCTPKLPIELIGEIYKHLEAEQDQAAFRRASKRISHGVTALFFEQIRLSRSLETLEKIASSHLANFVKRVHFFPDLVSDLDRERWTSLMNPLPAHLGYFQECQKRGIDRKRAIYMCKPERAYPPAPNRYETQWLLYRTILQEQRRWRGDLKGLVIKEHLLKLPNLHEATVYVVSDTRKAQKQAVWEHPRPGNEERIISTAHTLDTTGTSTANFVEAIGFRQRKKQRNETPVEKLRIRMSEMRTLYEMIGWCEKSSENVAIEARYKDVLRACKPLTSLEIDWPRHDPAHAEEAQHILGRAKKLKTLRFKYGEPGCVEDLDSSIDLGSGLLPFLSGAANAFSQLQTLEISATIPARAFANFLTLHTETLRELTVRHCVCNDWEIVLKAIAKLQLDHLCLSNLHYLEDQVDDQGNARRREYRITRFNTASDVAGDVSLNFAMASWFAQGGEGGLPQEYYDDGYCCLHGGDFYESEVPPSDSEHPSLGAEELHLDSEDHLPDSETRSPHSEGPFPELEPDLSTQRYLLARSGNYLCV